MLSNSVCNHTRDKQIGLPLRGRLILLITRMIRPNRIPLKPITTIYNISVSDVFEARCCLSDFGASLEASRPDTGLTKHRTHGLYCVCWFLAICDFKRKKELYTVW